MNNSVRIGHEMLNHEGNRIFVTARTIQELSRRGYLGRDRATGLKYFDPKGYELFRDGEVGTPWWYELGPDLSGPNVPVCKCATCLRQKSDLEDSRLSTVRTEQIVSEIKKGRKR